MTDTQLCTEKKKSIFFIWEWEGVCTKLLKVNFSLKQSIAPKREREDRNRGHTGY